MGSWYHFKLRSSGGVLCLNLSRQSEWDGFGVSRTGKPAHSDGGAGGDLGGGVFRAHGLAGRGKSVQARIQGVERGRPRRRHGRGQARLQQQREHGETDACRQSSLHDGIPCVPAAVSRPPWAVNCSPCPGDCPPGGAHNVTKVIF